MRIFAFHSLVPGVRFYRLTAPTKYLSSDYHHEIIFEDTSHQGLDSSGWQTKALEETFHGVLEQLMGNVDLIVTQLVHSDAALAVLQGVRSFYGVPLVLDLDDNVENVPYYNRGSQVYTPDSGLLETTRELMDLVDAITVSTPYLAERMRQYSDNIHVLPNSIDFELWDKPVQVPNKKSIRIGWAGAQTHEDDFKLVKPALKEILRKYPNVRLYILGGVPDCLADFNHPRLVKKVVWYDIFDYPVRLKHWNFDIGIAPLRDNAFNRAKSNLRWLEYSAMGIPTVAGNVEPFSRSIAHGKTGMLAYEPDEWVACLSELIEDKSMRLEIGQAANDKVRRDYNMKRNARIWDSVYRGVVEQVEVPT